MTKVRPGVHTSGAGPLASFVDGPRAAVGALAHQELGSGDRNVPDPRAEEGLQQHR